MSRSSSTTRIRCPSFILDSYQAAVGFPAACRHHPPVARVLVSEPHEDIRSLLAHVVRRSGHEAILHAEGAPLTDEPLDAAIVEPGAADSLALAAELAQRGVVLVFASIYPPDDATLALAPAAYLVKPFALSALEQALREALSLAAARA
jgi:CheY-like chemotaxis protein